MNQFNDLTTMLIKACDLKSLKVTDESHLHANHQQFQAKKAYLRMIVTPHQKVNRLALHRKILQLAFDFMPIHALSIQINTP
jgi:stress-induced morphogen